LLEKLHIENYALVEKAVIKFGPGLTVLTGETGAGKSVIIGGLLVALGGRADRDFIRHGADKAVIAAEFDLDSSSLPRKKICDELDISTDSMLALRREISRGGASRAYAGDSVVSLAKIKNIAPLLADFHSQQGQRSLLDVDRHIDFLDSFAGLTKTVEELAERYHAFVNLDKRLADAQNNAAAMRDRLELVNFQIDELTKAGIRIGEEAELETERRRLDSIQTLMETGQNIITAVSEDENAVVSILSQLDKRLREAAEIDGNLAEDAKLFGESIVNLNELTRNIQSYLSRLEDDPERLEAINERLAELFRLKKKYGTDEAGLTAKLDELKKESGGISDYDALIEELQSRLGAARKAYVDLAMEVSAKRRTAAPRLEKAVIKQLNDLAINKARFKIDVQREYDENGIEIDGEKVAAMPQGLENVEFLISTNPNEPLKPLVKIASGGELSRIMLALLSIIAGKYKLPTVIFDEIDSGIGGVTAKKLAAKLKDLSAKHQIIVISHLPVIAEQADHNLAVSKTLKDGRNVITVKEVTGVELEKELGRLLGQASDK
jgi:DNA repair protein RecN (Recombination protein N)